MATKQLDIRARLEQARDAAAAARAEADRALQPTLEQIAALEAEASRLEAQVAEKQAQHEREVQERYRRQPFALGPFLREFTDAVHVGDLAAAFAAYRRMRVARNGRIAVGEVFGLSIDVGAAEPKFEDWLRSALMSADSRDRDEAGAKIRAELEGEAT